MFKKLHYIQYKKVYEYIKKYLKVYLQYKKVYEYKKSV